ncbi:hypothetical protein [Botrimarina mediterranea]|nr:hypothetical protein [Botrimarina mediterranea]
MQKTIVAALAVLASACFTGCGDGRPTRVPVAGRVVIDGEPVRFGMIKLSNPDTRAASGRLDGEGRFQLTCFEKHDGVIPGTHRVEVAATEGIDDRTVRWHAPKKYADQSTSGIEVTIDEPTDDLVIELTWSGGKGPFVERQ